MKISPDEFAHLQIATSKQPGPAQVIGCPAAVGSQMQIRLRLMSAEIDIEIQRSMRDFAYNLGKFVRSRRFALLCAGLAGCRAPDSASITQWCLYRAAAAVGNA